MGLMDEFIDRIALAGVKLPADGDRLLAETQPGARMTGDLRQLIRENKAALLSALRSNCRVQLRRQRVLARRCDVSKTDCRAARIAQGTPEGSLKVRLKVRSTSPLP